MDWSPLGTQFCLELAFGVLLAMLLVHRVPVGLFFHRLMGTAALVPALLATAMPPLSGGAGWSDPQVVLAGLVVLAYPFFAGPLRARRRALALGVAIIASASALALAVRSAAAVSGPLEHLVAVLSALATGSVAGTVGLAMVLGHWYLTIPELDVEHLARVIRISIACMLLSLAALAASCLVFEGALVEEGRSLFGPFGLFHLGTRIAVGLILPLVFAWMASASLRYHNTRSATGILYASTVLVMIGTAASVSLQGSYGIPL